MATTLRTLLLNIEARSAQFERSVDRVEKRTASLDRGMKVLGGTLLGVFSARTLLRGISHMSQAIQAGEQSTFKLNAVLRTTGFAAGRTADEIDRLAGTLAQNTLFNDDDIRNTAAQLATFKNIQGAVFDQTIAAITNMATVMDQDLRSTVIQVGKALNDPILGVTALRRVGVQLTAQQTEMVQSFIKVNDIASAQGVILRELAGEFGGAAEQANRGLAGAISGVTKEMDNLFEALGRIQGRGGLAGILGGLSPTALLRELQQVLRFGLPVVPGFPGISLPGVLTIESLRRQGSLNVPGMGAGALPGEEMLPRGIQPTIAPVGPVIAARNVGGGGFAQQIEAGRPNVSPLAVALHRIGTEGLQNLERQIDTTKILAWEQQQGADAAANAAMNTRRMALAGLQAANALMQVARGGGGFFGTLGGILGTAGAFLTATGAGGLFLGPALAAGGGLIGGLAGGRKNEPVPVIIRDYDQQAIDKIRREGPDTVIVVVKQGDQEISRVAYQLQRGSRRDAYERVSSNIIPGTA